MELSKSKRKTPLSVWGILFKMSKEKHHMSIFSLVVCCIAMILFFGGIVTIMIVVVILEPVGLNKIEDKYCNADEYIIEISEDHYNCCKWVTVINEDRAYEYVKICKFINLNGEGV